MGGGITLLDTACDDWRAFGVVVSKSGLQVVALEFTACGTALLAGGDFEFGDSTAPSSLRGSHQGGMANRDKPQPGIRVFGRFGPDEESGRAGGDSWTLMTSLKGHDTATRSFCCMLRCSRLSSRVLVSAALSEVTPVPGPFFRF